MDTKLITMSNVRLALSLPMMALILTACGGGSGDADSGVTNQVSIPDNDADIRENPRGPNGSYLFVTHQSQVLGVDSEQLLYYSSQDVGTTSTYAVRIANRGADIYPLKNVSIMPTLAEPDQDTTPEDNSEEFSTQLVDGIVLQPAEAITVNVSFSPITEGPKSARFVVDYETIKMVDESVNINELSYYSAAEYESAGQFRTAQKVYTNYLANDPVTTNKRRAAIRLPIVAEAETYDSEEDLVWYLEVMQERDNKNYDQALRKLDTLAAIYPDSYLADDAQYLKGYIELIDLNNPQNALREMQLLREKYPDTNYYDTSLYVEAIAQIEIGNGLLAKRILEDLKQRHTSTYTFGIPLPKDNLVSRMWFDRASQMLETVG